MTLWDPVDVVDVAPKAEIASLRAELEAEAPANSDYPLVI